MVLDELSDYLSTSGLGTQGADWFDGFLPDKPNSAGAIYETGGVSPALAMRPAPGRPVARRPRVQVVWRSTSYAAARQKVEDAYNLLHGFGDRTLGDGRYLWVGAVQEPFEMGRDTEGRVLVACNFDVVRSTTTG